MELVAALAYFEAKAKRNLAIIARYTDDSRIIAGGEPDITKVIIKAVEAYHHNQGCVERINTLINGSKQLKKETTAEKKE